MWRDNVVLWIPRDLRLLGIGLSMRLFKRRLLGRRLLGRRLLGRRLLGRRLMNRRLLYRGLLDGRLIQLTIDSVPGVKRLSRGARNVGQGWRGGWYCSRRR